MYQHVSEPTRFRIGEEPSLLDLVLTNEEGMIQNLEYQPGLGNSDHLSLIFDLGCKKQMTKDTKPQPNFFKTNFGSIRKKLRNFNWKETLNGTFADDYGKFMVILTSIIETDVPKRKRFRGRKNIYMHTKL